MSTESPDPIALRLSGLVNDSMRGLRFTKTAQQVISRRVRELSAEARSIFVTRRPDGLETFDDRAFEEAAGRLAERVRDHAQVLAFEIRGRIDEEQVIRSMNAICPTPPFCRADDGRGSRG